MQQNSQIAAVDCKMDSDSESVEDSQMDQSSEFDEAALRKEEQIKLAQMFENQDKRVAINSSSKVKLPYEMLINKLIDSLDTHELTMNRQLPVPKGFNEDVVAPKKQIKIDK